MPMKPSRPLPRRFRRAVSPATRTFVERKHERRKKVRTEKWKRTARHAQRWVFDVQEFIKRWILVGAVILAALLVAVFLFSPLFRVREIQIDRQSRRIDIEDVQQKLSSLFRRHLLFISSTEVEALLKKSTLDLESVTVDKEYPSRLNVSLKLQPLMARMMVESPTPAEVVVASGAAIPVPKKTFDYITDNGIFVSLPEAGTDQPLPVITLMDWAARPVHGTKLIDPAFIQHMLIVEEALRRDFNFQTKTRQIYLRAREFHLDNGKLSLWFDDRDTPAEEMARYRTFLKAVGLPAVKQYVDLRLAGRVVYK